MEFNESKASLTKGVPSGRVTDTGKQTSGQKRPARKDADGNEITAKKLGEADTDRKPAPLFSDPKTRKDKLESGGYGTLTSGTYDASLKGLKTYGTSGQGSEKKGVKDPTTAECADRWQLVTVTAKTDAASSDTVLLEAGSYSFDLTGATALKAFATSAAALFAVSQF